MNRCSAEDYLGLFAREADQLHLLCNTLTGDENRSRLSFNMLSADRWRAPMEFLGNGSQVGLGVSLLRPASAICAEIQSASRRSFPPVFRQFGPVPETSHLLAQITPEVILAKLPALDVLSRFVFVLRVLENYSRFDFRKLRISDQCYPCLSVVRFCFCHDGDYLGSFSLSLDLFSSRKARRLSAWSSRRVHCSK